MKQSDRLRYVKEYQSNPLRREYERNKDLVIKKPFVVRLINLGNVFFVFMFFYYGWIFFVNDSAAYVAFEKFAESTFGFTLLPLLALGIGNIFLGLVYFVYSDQWKKNIIEMHNSDAIEKLNKEYRKKGLYPIDESELFKYSCCDYDDVYETLVCPVTKGRINNSDYNYCDTPGNCRKCKTFMKAYMGDDWNGEYNHEYN